MERTRIIKMLLNGQRIRFPPLVMLYDDLLTIEYDDTLIVSVNLLSFEVIDAGVVVLGFPKRGNACRTIILHDMIQC